jgi:Histidine phosphatase superfamily (branch 2)
MMMIMKYRSVVWFMFFLSWSPPPSSWRFLPSSCHAALEEQEPSRRRQQQQDDGNEANIPPHRQDYPDYCSTKDQIEATRHIPPLRSNDGDDHVGETRLIHVAAITRHGARTPLLDDSDDAAGSFCWKGYMDADADTSVWDCSLTTWMGTPPVHAIQVEEGMTTPVVPLDDSLMWMDKRYDAFAAAYSSSYSSSSSSSSISNNNNMNHAYLSNRLNGTCQTGQLLTHGYHQLHDIGRILRTAYLYPSDSTQEGYKNHDERLRLTSDTFQNSKLSFRVDDLPRTILSGQALFHGLFGHEPSSSLMPEESVIPMTMVDYSRDVFGIHQESCPRLQELNAQALISPDFLALQQSPEARLWTKFLQAHFGRVPRNTIDCLMTTICSDKTLPSAIDDFVNSSTRRRRRRRRHLDNSTSIMTTTSTPLSSPAVISPSASSSEWDDEYGRDRFRRLLQFSTQNISFPFTYQNAVISKLAMAPLWQHLLKNIKAATKSESIDDTSYPKLALVSSHDSTIWALLASLGMTSLLDHVPPYASLLLLEIHELIGGSRNTSTFASNFALRIVYNGNVVTSLLPGCSSTSDLCDLQVLTKLHVETFASTTRQRNCSVTTATAPTSTMAGSDGSSSSNNSNTTDSNGGAGAPPPPPALNTLVAGLSSQDIQETREAFRSPVGIFGLTLLAIISFGFGSMITVCILSKQHRYDTF